MWVWPRDAQGECCVMSVLGDVTGTQSSSLCHNSFCVNEHFPQAMTNLPVWLGIRSESWPLQVMQHTVPLSSLCYIKSLTQQITTHSWQLTVLKRARHMFATHQFITCSVYFKTALKWWIVHKTSASKLQANSLLLVKHTLKKNTVLASRVKSLAQLTFKTETKIPTKLSCALDNQTRSTVASMEV